MEAHFGDASLSNKVYLKRSLFKLQQDELQSCLDVTSQILAIADRLSQMRFELSPLDLVIVLLAALHPRVEQIERLPDDQLTWANVTRKRFMRKPDLLGLSSEWKPLQCQLTVLQNVHLKLKVDPSQCMIPKMIWFVLIVLSGGTLKTGVSREQKI